MLAQSCELEVAQMSPFITEEIEAQGIEDARGVMAAGLKPRSGALESVPLG